MSGSPVEIVAETPPPPPEPAPSGEVPAPAPAPVKEATAPAPSPAPEAAPTAEPDPDLPISSGNIEHVQQSFIAVALDSDETAEMFYGRLLEAHPELENRFTGEMKTYGHQPIEIIQVMVAGILSNDSVLPVVRELGNRYREYGVEVSDYAAVAEALMWTLEQKLGDGFTPDIRNAWVNFYALIAETMIKGPSE
ncbi:MAG: globin domain-containing protein [Alphaproteobacteria bacterium]